MPIDSYSVNCVWRYSRCRIIGFYIWICHELSFIKPSITAPFKRHFITKIITATAIKSQILPNIFFITCSNLYITINCFQFIKHNKSYSLTCVSARVMWRILTLLKLIRGHQFKIIIIWLKMRKFTRLENGWNRPLFCSFWNYHFWHVQRSS